MSRKKVILIILSFLILGSFFLGFFFDFYFLNRTKLGDRIKTSIKCNFAALHEKLIKGDILTSGKIIYSSCELIIRDFFHDRKEGVFVDVGCYHYKISSNTYYLEKHLGWSGIAVDALAEFVKGYIENRPKTRFFNFIVTDHSWNIQPFYRFKPRPYVSSIKSSDKKSQIVYVPTITLTELLDKNGISKIDFLSMDIEKSEPAALAGFDIKRFKPELVCIEAQLETRKEILDYFTRNNYERIEKYREHDLLNWYFKPKD